MVLVNYVDVRSYVLSVVVEKCSSGVKIIERFEPLHPRTYSPVQRHP